MPEVIRFAKGTASEHLNFTGENGEITLICDDTPNRKVTGVIRLHDGQTVGGIPFGGSQLLNDMHDVNAANTIEFQVMTVDANGQFYFANTVETIADGTISGDKIYGGTISTSAAVFEGSSANAIVRITQTGTGNALVVEDSANPDSTPFVIDAAGRLLVGHDSSVDTRNYLNNSLGGPTFQQHGTTQGSSIAAIYSWVNNLFAPSALVLNKSISGTIGTRGALTASNTDIGAIVFAGDDGTNFISAAAILAEVDGTPGTNDMPGRLVFSTTADGASSPTERMRIDSSGRVGIGTNSPASELNVYHATDPEIRLTISPHGDAAVLLGDADGLSLFAKGAANQLRFYTGTSQRMRIDSSGNVLIGTTTDNGVDKLQVNGNISSSNLFTPIVTSLTNTDFSTKQFISPALSAGVYIARVEFGGVFNVNYAYTFIVSFAVNHLVTTDYEISTVNSSSYIKVSNSFNFYFGNQSKLSMKWGSSALNSATCTIQKII